MAQVPSVSVKYATNGSSAKPNYPHRRAIQECVYEKSCPIVMGQKVNTP